LSVVGLIEGVAETTASLLKVFSGWLSDRLGDRKWLTVAGYSLSTLAKPFLVVANTWGAVLAVRFADRVGKGIRTAPRDALVADSIDEKRRGLAFGLHRAGDTAGAMFGLLIALGVVYALQGADLTLQRPTFQTIVLISIAPAVLAVLVLIVGARNVPVTSQRGRPRLSLAGFDPRFKRFLLVMVLFTLGNSSDAFLVLRAQDLGLSVAGVMGVLVLFNLVYALISTPAGALSDRIGRRTVIVGGWLAYAAIYLGFGLASAAWQIWALFALYGIYYGLAEGAGKALVADVVQPAQRGTAYGVYNAAIGLAAFPASLIAGLLWQGVAGWAGFGPAAPFLFGAGMALLAVVVLMFWLPRGGPIQDTA
jgi:MFS family permease